MVDRERLEPHPEHVDRAVVFDRTAVKARYAAPVRAFSRESIREHPQQRVHRRLRGVNRDAISPAVVEGAYVVEAHDVVRVVVRVEDRVQPAQIGAQRLLSEVGARVDDHVPLGAVR